MSALHEYQSEPKPIKVNIKKHADSLMPTQVWQTASSHFNIKPKKGAKKEEDSNHKSIGLELPKPRGSTLSKKSEYNYISPSLHGS